MNQQVVASGACNLRLNTVILAAALALSIHAQITGQAVPFTVHNPVLPTEYADSPLPCASGLKLQRYHEARPGNMGGGMSARIPEDYGDPAGWVDVDATKPHEGDYRCVREPEGVLGDYIKPGMNGAGAGDVETFDPSIPHDVSREGYHPSKDNPGCLESPSSDILICPDAADKPRIFVRDNVKIITHEPYDGLGMAFPLHPIVGETWHHYRWDGQAWKWAEPQVTDPASWRPTATGMNTCGMDAHLHAKGAKFDSPDVKSAKTPPIGDGRCYKDLDDSPVPVHSRKLEAKR